MANEKTQFDEQELEQYGVWVKAGPEEVVEEDDEFTFSDLPAGQEPAAPPAQPDAELNIDDIDLDSDDLGDLGSVSDATESTDFGIDDLDLDEDSDFAVAASAADPDTDLGDDLDLDLEEIGVEATDSIDGPNAASSDDPLLHDEEVTVGATPDLVPESAAATEDLDLPDLDDIALDDEIDLALDDMPTVEEIQSEVGAMDEPDDDGDMVSLDDLDIDEPDDEPDPFSALSGAEPSAAQTDSVPETDAEVAEINLDELNEGGEAVAADIAAESFDAPLPSADDSIPGSDSEIDDLRLDDISIDDDEELPELEANEHDFTPEDQAIAIIPEGPATTISEEEAQFLNAGTPDQSAAAPTDPAAFAKIQSELSEIRNELADLKRALREGRGAVAVAPAEPDLEPEPQADVAPVAEEPPTSPLAEAEPGPGFFDEDEDETIALTGDELDNILNTAEFTEETGEAEEMDDDFMVALDPNAAPTAAPEPEAAAESIDLEPVESAPFVVEGDESAVDELADMNIDQELADIERLNDDSSSEPEFEEVELDMDTIEEIEEGSAAAEAQADTVVLDDLEVSDADLDADFDSFADSVEQELEIDSPHEPTADEIEIEDLDLDSEPMESSAPAADSEQVLEPEPSEAPAVPEDADFVNEASLPVGDGTSIGELPDHLKDEIRSVLSYMDQLLEALPDDKIEEFAQSEHFAVYKRLFEELGLES